MTSELKHLTTSLTASSIRYTVKFRPFVLVTLLTLMTSFPSNPHCPQRWHQIVLAKLSNLLQPLSSRPFSTQTCMSYKVRTLSLAQKFSVVPHNLKHSLHSRTCFCCIPPSNAMLLHPHWPTHCSQHTIYSSHLGAPAQPSFCCLEGPGMLCTSACQCSTSS